MLEKLNDTKLLEIKENAFRELEAKFRGERRREIYLRGVVAFASQVDPYAEPELWIDENLAALAAQASVDDAHGRYVIPYCVEYNIYGVHFVDTVLGARVFRKDGQWYNDYLASPVGALTMPDLDADATWALARRAARRFVEANLAVPVFGMPTLSSALNIGVNLYGQEMLCAMFEEPEAARRDLRVINDVIMALHAWNIANVPKASLQPVISWERTQPYGYGQVCGCTTQLLSPELYAEFVAPLDNAVLGLYEHGGMMHLCGEHTHHLPTLRAMRNLKAVQLNDRAAHDLQRYYDELRDDQIVYLNPCDGMSAERALDITDGNRLVICG